MVPPGIGQASTLDPVAYRCWSVCHDLRLLPEDAYRGPEISQQGMGLRQELRSRGPRGPICGHPPYRLEMQNRRPGIVIKVSPAELDHDVGLVAHRGRLSQRALQQS
jgi:hypothetical protein